MSCLLCSSPPTTGVLCTRHGVAIASPRISSEQIQSRAGASQAALVDAWGCAHGITDGVRIGRDRERNDIAVLHASVSSEHAAFRHLRGKWRVVDQSSRNGIEIDGRRVRDQAVVDAGDTIRFGDVAFYFWNETLPKGEPPRGQGRTARAGSIELYRATAVTGNGDALVLFQRAEDGLLRIADVSIELGMMEFGLLRLLVERRREVGDPEFAYVAWHEIADALSFRSIETDAENVRELIHRLRRKVGDGLIETKRGVGYRIAAVPA